MNLLLENLKNTIEVKKLLNSDNNLYSNNPLSFAFLVSSAFYKSPKNIALLLHYIRHKLYMNISVALLVKKIVYYILLMKFFIKQIFLILKKCLLKDYLSWINVYLMKKKS